MSVLAVDRVRVDPPSSLPVDYLSLSSLKQFMMCPEKWRRRYVEHEPEPPSGKMLLGSAAGAALGQHFALIVESGVGLSTEALLDEFSAEWDGRIGRETVDWGTDTAGALKDSGVGALRAYHIEIAPGVQPVAVEREFELSWMGCDWRLTGFLDLEEADGTVSDLKMRGRRMSQNDADSDLQPLIYLAARRAEENPATGFRFQCMVRTKKPTAEIVATSRTDRQLDLLTDRIFGLAREIEYRCESGNWGGASPGTWFCGACRYADCPLRLG